jgi:O-antigen/teichoic acid export membrane protein
MSVPAPLPQAGDGAGGERAAAMASGHGRHVASGSLKLLAVQALALVTGFLIAAFLSRQLGPELYGLFSVAATIVIWVELSATVMFSQTTIKFLAEAEDGRAVASTLTQVQFLASLVATALLVVAAPALASWLRSPELATYLRLFALDIPLFALTRAHRAILTGREAFGQVAAVTALRWLTRLALVLLLVGLGFSLTGAILASIGASAVQLVVVRFLVRPSLLARPAFPLRRLAGYALPLFFYTIGLRLFRQLDLLVVKAVAATPAAAGYYGAAQNLTIVPLSMFGASVAPLLLATLTRLLRQRQDPAARAMAAGAMRLVLCLLPFAGLAAGSAPDLVTLVYGERFLPAAPLVALLIFAALAIVLISVAGSVLTAVGRPGLTFALTGPLLPLALAAHLLLIPRVGPVGAAAATTLLAWIAAAAMALAVRRHCRAAPSWATLLRTALLTVAAGLLSSAWPTSGPWLLLELLLLASAVLAGLFLLGELTRQDLAFARSLFRLERRPSP